MEVSAGLLLYRHGPHGLEVFLAHPGGPWWTGRDAGAWTIPKGLIEPGEDPLVAARREFQEETGFTPEGPFLPLGSIRLKSGKIVHAWAAEGEADPARFTSGVFEVEWPRHSGHTRRFPEIDRCGWFDLATAAGKLNPSQVALLGRLERVLNRAAS
jgi:predicted NUDIX family NTP pyrophosphohydrolase